MIVVILGCVYQGFVSRVCPVRLLHHVQTVAWKDAPEECDSPHRCSQQSERQGLQPMQPGLKNVDLSLWSYFYFVIWQYDRGTYLPIWKQPQYDYDNPTYTTTLCIFTACALWNKDMEIVALHVDDEKLLYEGKWCRNEVMMWRKTNSAVVTQNWQFRVWQLE